MNDSLRLFAAILVATWSPGHWCACALGTTPAEGGCHGRVQLQVDEEAATCCSVEAPDEPETQPDPCCGSGVPGEEDSCPCLHAPTDAVPPAAPSVAPAGGKGPAIDLLVEQPPVLSLATGPRSKVTACRGSPRAGPPQTLYALHCLLTT